MRHFAGDGIENAAVFLLARQALGRVAAIAEQSLENHARIDLHGQRLRGRAPGDRIHVSAAIADVADAHQSGVLDAQFERRQRRVLADLLGRDLIDGGAGANVFAFGAQRVDAA